MIQRRIIVGVACGRSHFPFGLVRLLTNFGEPLARQEGLCALEVLEIREADLHVTITPKEMDDETGTECTMHREVTLAFRESQPSVQPAQSFRATYTDNEY